MTMTEPALTSNTLDEGAIAEIKKKYPSLAPWLDNPDIRRILQEATEQEWDNQDLQQALQGTTWWKTTPGTLRQWAQQGFEDPANQNRAIEQQQLLFENEARRNGWTVEPAQMRTMAIDALRFGYSDAEKFSMLADYAETQQASGVKPSPRGNQQYYQDEISKLAHSYLIPGAASLSEQWSRELIEGTTTLDGITAYMRDVARQQYPYLGSQLDAGITPEQYFRPLKSQVSSILDMPIEAVDFTDDRYSEITQMVDDGGNIRPMTFSEAGRWARHQPQWQFTDDANQRMYSTAESILKTMGAYK